MPEHVSRSLGDDPFWGVTLLLAAGLVACPSSERATTPDSRAPELAAQDEREPNECQTLPAQLGSSAPDPAADHAGAQAAFRRALELRESGSWSAAEQAFSDALALDPDFGLAHMGVAEALAYTGGSPERRKTHLAAALRALPENPRAHVRFADTLEAEGSGRAAMTHLRCALRLRADLRHARRRAARLALELEGPEAAEQTLKPLFERSPEARDWILVAEVRTARGARTSAAQAMARAAEVAGSAPLYRRAAALWDEAERPQEAAAARERADLIDPPERRKLRQLPRSRVRR